MAKKKNTGVTDIDFMVIAESADGSETKRKVEAMDAASALDHALNMMLIDQDAVSFRVVPMSHWRRLQRAERKGRKDGKVVKLPKRSRRKGVPAGLRELPASVQQAYLDGCDMAGT